MELLKSGSGSELTIAVKGRLDTTTAPQLEAELSSSLDGVTKLILDFAGLEYISSAGLRVLLAVQKTMNRQGEMTVRGATPAVCEIFDITGFCDILTLE